MDVTSTSSYTCIVIMILLLQRTSHCYIPRI